MPLPPVHFAVGMGVSSLLGPLMVLVRRRRWLIYLPLIMSLCGGLSLVPDLVARGGDLSPLFDFGDYSEREHSHAPVMNLFFFHPWLDGQHWLDTRHMTNLAFHAVALIYLASACGYAVYIRWGLARSLEAREALVRLRRAAASYRAAAVVVGVVPLLLAGGAVAFVVQTMRTPAASAYKQALEERRRWGRLVESRTGLYPGRKMGLVHRVCRGKGSWVPGDLVAFAGPGDRATSVADVAARAHENGCRFVVIADAEPASTPEQRAAQAQALADARVRHGEMAILRGLAWRAPLPGGGVAPAVVVLASEFDEDAFADRFWRQFDRGSPAWRGKPAEAGLAWLKAQRPTPRALPAVFALPPTDDAGSQDWGELFSWRRTNEVFAGVLGVYGSQRLSARAARSRWDSRVARMGGTWDQLLDRGFRIWGAAAASGFTSPAKHFWPGLYARTHVWCPDRGTQRPEPADVVAGLRSGCFWAAEGGVVRALDFGVIARTSARPARMGEVAWVPPGEEVTVALTLDIPPTDFAGRRNQVDEVELISNFAGESEVVRRVTSVATGRRILHTFPPAADHNGGLGFTVRARGWRRLEDGSRLFFYTNPVRVLVREGLPPTGEPSVPPTRVVKGPSASPTTAMAGTATTAAAQPPDAGDRLEAIGLPASVRPLHVETFQAPPPPAWRGEHTSYVTPLAGGGLPAQSARPAIKDREQRVEFVHKTPLTEHTRLFFRCYAEADGRLAVLVRTSQSTTPYQLVRRVWRKREVDIDLSLIGDFHSTRGSAGVLRTPATLEAIEWRGEGLGKGAEFYVTNVVFYEPTPASRLELARRRAGQPATAGPERRVGEVEPELARAAGGSAPSAAWQARADAVRQRLATVRQSLYQDDADAAHEALPDAERQLGALLDECRRLDAHAAMARASAEADPRFAVGIGPAAQRFSARNPALPALPPPARAWDVSAAGGEAESFQIVVGALWEKLSDVRVSVSDFLPADGRGSTLPATVASVYLVDEVRVQPRAELLPSQTGWVPDPLRPFAPFDVEPGGVRSVLVTLRLSHDVPPGSYRGVVTVCPDGLDAVRLAVNLRRWDFALADRHFPVIAPIDERAMRKRWKTTSGMSDELRRQLYAVLLRHRVDPVPLLGGDEAAERAEATFCLEHGSGLVVLHEAVGAAPRTRDPGVVRAARLAVALRQDGWGRRGALLLRRMPEKSRARILPAINAIARAYPELLVIAGGEGDPPPGIITHYWRQPLGAESPRLPGQDEITTRRSRTARREAWELVSAPPDAPLPNLLLTNTLLHVRVLPWLAWKHGVRAFLLRGATSWDGTALGDGVLVHPFGPAGATDGGRAPCASLRLVALRDGIEDYETLRMTWERASDLRDRAEARHAQALAAAERLLRQAENAAGTFAEPCPELRVLATFRAHLARNLEQLENAWWVEIDNAEDLPAPPADVRAEPGDRSIRVSWAKSPADSVKAYDLFRSCDPRAGFVRVNPRPIHGLTYLDRAVSNDAAYHYFVRSRDPKGVNGPRSPLAQAAPRAAPRVVWMPMAHLRATRSGAYRVALRLEGPGTGGILPLVRPRLDYAVGDRAYVGFEDMTRQDGGSWVFDIPDPGWRRHAGSHLRLRVLIVDRRNQLVTPAVERIERIDDNAPAPR